MMAAEKKQITRNRASLSCQTCRRRKVKCGKERPICATCQKAGEECVYVDGDQPNAPRATDQTVVSRKRHEPDTGFDQQSIYGLDTSLHAMRAMEQKLNQLSALVRDMNRLTPVSSSNSPKDDQSKDSAPFLDFLGTRSSESFGTAATGSSLPDASILRVLTKLDDLNVLLKSNFKQINQFPTPLSRLSTDSDQEIRGPHRPATANSGQPLTKGTVLPGLNAEDIMSPSVEESNVLFRSWLWSVYPIFPLVSPYLVLEKYENFRKWYRDDIDRGIPIPDPTFMPFMLVMWLTGQNALTERSRKKWFPWIKEGTTWYRTICSRIEQYLTVMQTDSDRSFWILAASVIYRQLRSGGQDLTKSNVQNLLNIRSAQALGLHSERMVAQTELSEAESRRRVWWEISYADASLSLNSGMPTLIEDCYTDTKEISELKDVWLGTADAKEYEELLREDGAQPDPVDDANSSETSSLISVFYLVSKARGIATQTLRKVLRVNMNARSMPMAELKELRKSMATARKQIEDVISRIPTRGAPEFDFAPQTQTRSTEPECSDSMSRQLTKQEIRDFLREDDRSGSLLTANSRMALSSFHKWARISLSAILDGLECASYAPFLRNSKSRLWGVSRNCALRVSHAFLRKYLSLAEAEDLQRYRWTWPLLFNPMHAAIIMLVDLHERPHSDEAPRSRALIDEVFSLSSYEKGVIDFRSWPNTSLPFREGGDEAWMMLRKLRHKAWHKAGLDPDVLWTEEEQMQVGVGKPLSENDLFIRSLREDIIMSHKQRIDRLGSSNNNDSTIQKVMRQKIRQAAAKQYMHPSQVGPGERVTGSVTPSMVDWDAAELPQVLLLRAQQDQESMPFPPSLQITTTSIDAQPDTLFGFPRPKNSKDQNDTLHLGDLIRKIKQTQIDRTTDDTQNLGARSTTDVPAPLGSVEDPMCTFRTQQRAMDAAFGDLVDRHAMPEVLNSKPTTDTASLEEPSFPTQPVTMNNTPRFSYFPFAPASMAQVEQFNPITKGYEQQQSSEVAYSNSLEHSSCDPMCQIPTNESMQQCPDHSIVDTDATQNIIPQNVMRDLHANSYFFNNLAANRDTTADAVMMNSNGMAADFDFDWARWDEMFGTTQGFEDIMMDLANEELQHAGSNHEGPHLGGI